MKETYGVLDIRYDSVHSCAIRVIACKLKIISDGNPVLILIPLLEERTSQLGGAASPAFRDYCSPWIRRGKATAGGRQRPLERRWGTERPAARLPSAQHQSSCSPRHTLSITCRSVASQRRVPTEPVMPTVHSHTSLRGAKQRPDWPQQRPPHSYTG